MTEEQMNTSLDLWNSLTMAHDTIRKAHVRQMAMHKLTAPQFHVLKVLMKSGPIPLKRISEALLVTGANITCVVDNLEKEALVRRVPSKKDRRVINAELTDSGVEKIKDLFPEYVSSLDGSTNNLSNDEKVELNTLLKKMIGE